MQLKRSQQERRDKRRPVEQRRPEAPFQSIGRLVTSFVIPGKTKQENVTIKYTSTAFIVGENLIMASIESFFKPQYGREAKFFKFYPFKSDKSIEVTMVCVTKYKDFFDNLVVMILQPDQRLRRLKCLKINWQFHLEQHVQEKVIISGYSHDLIDGRSQGRQFYTETKPSRQLRSQLFYEHTGDLTGCPIILRKQQYGKPDTFQVIGIHNSNQEIEADGILFTLQSRENLTVILQEINAVNRFPQKLGFSKRKLTRDNQKLLVLGKKWFGEVSDAIKLINHLKASNQQLMRKQEELNNSQKNGDKVDGSYYAMKTFKENQKFHYHITSQQQIACCLKNLNITLSADRYTLDHYGVDFDMKTFLKFDWNNLQALRLSFCKIDDSQFGEFLDDYRSFPNLIVLVLSNNEINTLPIEIQNIKTLEQLNLTGNKLKQSSILYIESEYHNKVKNVYFTKKDNQNDETPQQSIQQKLAQ